MPPIITGLPSLSTSGAIACTWVERIDPGRPRFRLRGELGERQHDAGIGGLIVLDDQFDLLAEDAAGLVDRFQRKLGALCAHSRRIRRPDP